MTRLIDWFGCGKTFPEMGEAKGFLAGIECEIEGIPPGKNKDVGNFLCKEDGSLRNNGWEYITQYPKDRKTLIEETTALHSFLKLDPKKDPFSYRTSVHVHVNCASITLEQTRNIILLYALFEDFFFAMVKPIRRDNIHCVALTDTYLPSKYHLNLQGIHQNWHKYTALNACRLKDLGTLEFRHMHGTGDMNELNVWLSVLENVWTLGQTVEISADTLSNKEVVREWFNTIFAPSETIASMKTVLFDVIRNTLIDVKMSTI